VSTLPKDRLSQVTRRGMISEPRGRASPHAPANRGRGRATPHAPANRGRAPRRDGPIQSGMDRSPSRAASAGRRERREEVEREEMEVEESSPWNPPLAISRLLDVKVSKTVRKARCQSFVF